MVSMVSTQGTLSMGRPMTSHSMQQHSLALSSTGKDMVVLQMQVSRQQ
jgi:hypothetical protein